MWVKGLGAGSASQWDYKGKCKLHQKIVLKFKKKPNPKLSLFLSRSLEKPLLPARKYLPSDIIDRVGVELPDAVKPWELEQLTAGLIREPSIIGITDNQG